MANDVNKTVCSCIICERNGISLKVSLQLQKFPARDPFQLIAIYIIGSLPWTVNKNQNVTAMTDRFSKFAEAIPSGKTSLSSVANVFFDYWVVF